MTPMKLKFTIIAITIAFWLCPQSLASSTTTVTTAEAYATFTESGGNQVFIIVGRTGIKEDCFITCKACPFMPSTERTEPTKPPVVNDPANVKDVVIVKVTGLQPNSPLRCVVQPSRGRGCSTLARERQSTPAMPAVVICIPLLKQSVSRLVDGTTSVMGFSERCGTNKSIQSFGRGSWITARLNSDLKSMTMQRWTRSERHCGW
jgi:hypothetical protein